MKNRAIIGGKIVSIQEAENGGIKSILIETPASESPYCPSKRFVLHIWDKQSPTPTMYFYSLEGIDTP